MGKRTTVTEQLALAQQTLAEQAAKIAVLEASFSSAQALADSRYPLVAKVKELEETLVNVMKERDSAKSSRDYHSGEQTRVNMELEAVHTILDVLPGALPREIPDAKYGEKYTASLRLTVFAANAGKVGVK